MDPPDRPVPSHDPVLHIRALGALGRRHDRPIVRMDPAGQRFPIGQERRRLDAEQLADLRADEQEPVAAGHGVERSRPRDPRDVLGERTEPGSLGLDLVELRPGGA